MGKLFVNFLFLTVAIQSVAYLFWVFDISGGKLQYPVDLSTLQNLFSPLDTYSVLIGIGGAALIGLAALLLKQGTYAVYALLIWGIGIMFNVVRTFVIVIPNTLAAFLPESTNPLIGQTNPLIMVVLFWFMFGAWLAFFGYVIQREAT